MEKKSFELRKLVDYTIRIGDLVRLIDGSGLSCKDIDYPVIVCSYPKILDSTKTIEQLTAVVTNINQEYVSVSSLGDTCYLQDIEININGILFRTASQFVRNINQ